MLERGTDREGSVNFIGPNATAIYDRSCPNDKLLSIELLVDHETPQVFACMEVTPEKLGVINRNPNWRVMPRDPMKDKSGV